MQPNLFFFFLAHSWHIDSPLGGLEPGGAFWRFPITTPFQESGPTVGEIWTYAEKMLEGGSTSELKLPKTLQVSCWISSLTVQVVGK